MQYKGVSTSEDGAYSKKNPSTSRICKEKLKLCATFGIFSLSLLLIILSVVGLSHHYSIRSIALLVIGVLVLIPGSYGVYEVIATYYGLKGFVEGDAPLDDIDEEWTFNL